MEDKISENSVDVSLCLGCAVAKCVRGHSFPLYCTTRNEVCAAIDADVIKNTDDTTLEKLVKQRYVEHTSVYINKRFIRLMFEVEKDIVKNWSFAAVDYTERG